MPSKSPEEASKEFVQKANPACLGCKNFASSSCPAFQLAVQNGAAPKTLQAAIIEAQKDEPLGECSKQ